MKIKSIKHVITTRKNKNGAVIPMNIDQDLIIKREHFVCDVAFNFARMLSQQQEKEKIAFWMYQPARLEQNCKVDFLVVDLEGKRRFIKVFPTFVSEKKMGELKERFPTIEVDLYSKAEVIAMIREEEGLSFIHDKHKLNGFKRPFKKRKKKESGSPWKNWIDPKKP